MHDPVPLAIAAVLELLQGNGAAKHGDEWMTRDDREDMSHAKVHEVRYWDEEHSDIDFESNRLHLIHSIARRMLVLERRLMRDAD